MTSSTNAHPRSFGALALTAALAAAPLCALASGGADSDGVRNEPAAQAHAATPCSGSYLLCDDFVIPPERAASYRPEPLYVAPIYQANDRKRTIGAPVTRAMKVAPTRSAM